MQDSELKRGYIRYNMQIKVVKINGDDLRLVIETTLGLSTFAWKRTFM